MNNTKSVEAGERTQHPLTTGSIVDVLNTTLGGKQIIEGRATVHSPVKNRPHTYNVRFHDSGHNMTYQRFVMPKQEVKAEGKMIGPRVGKYGKAVVVKSIDPTFAKFAVIRPFCGTRFDTKAEADQDCDKHNFIGNSPKAVNEEARKYLASIGARGGAKSKRKLSKRDAKAMAQARWAKSKAKMPH